MTNSDPAIDEIRRVRHRISEQLDHEPAKLVERYRKLQQQEYSERMAANEDAADEPGRPAA